MVKVILDTDIGYGTDADDAVALAYLLRQAECELVGITTVGKRSDTRAEMADAICVRLGHPEIPIAAGSNQPLYANRYWRDNPVRRWPGEGELKPRRGYEPNRGLELMRRVIRENPSEVTLITIGQFTNLAMLLLVDPEAVGLLKAVVAMGGAMEYPVDQPVGETNVILDPIAAGIVFQRLGDQLTLVPIEAVRGIPLEPEELARIFEDPLMDGVRLACGGWKETWGKDRVGLADPLTVAMVFEPGLVEVARGQVSMQLYNHPLPAGEPFADDTVLGVTAFEENGEGPHHVVRASHGDKAHRHLMKVLGCRR